MIESYQKDLLKSFTASFEILVEKANQSKETSSLPKLEVSLRSGSRFSGNVVGLKKSEHENGNLLMLSEDIELNYKSRIHLILISEIVAISMIDPKSFLHIFSEEKAIISELELRRKTKSVEEQLEKIISTRIPVSLHLNTISESDRNHVLQMVETLPRIFESICMDKIGKNIVLSNIGSIEIRIEKTAHTKLENKNLVIFLSQTPDLIIANEKKRLLDSIEKAL